MDDDIHIAINLLPGFYVACVYDKEWYLANIVKMSEENRDVLLKFMKNSNMNNFTWLQKGDICRCL